MKKNALTADTAAPKAASSPAEVPNGLGTVGDLLDEMDRLQYRQGVLSALLDFLYGNFIGPEGEAPKTRVLRADGSEVAPREDVVTAITGEISRAGAAARDRLSAILAGRVQGCLPGNVLCVSSEGVEERGQAAHLESIQPAPRARTTRAPAAKKRRSSNTREPTA